jgi:hypothetical protein
MSAGKHRRLLLALATGAAALVAVVWWTQARDEEPQRGAPRAARGPHLYLSGKYGRVWRVGVDGSVVTARIPALDPGDPPHHLLRRGDRLVGWGYQSYLLDPGLEEDPELLVRDSLFFIPSAHEDRLWVATEAPGTNRRIATVREVTVDGRVTVPRTRPPGRRWPERALEAGLVFHDGDGWVVWDPVARRTVDRFDAEDLGPAHGNLLASCDSFCHDIAIRDVRTGRWRSVGPPEGFGAYAVWHAEFSPDGKTIAVPVAKEALDARLALVDVDAATVSVVAGTKTAQLANFVAWSADGSHVFFAGGGRPDGDEEIFVYEVGEAGARRLDVDVGEFYDAAAL